jgi:chemotaxis protein histidine kinase CheA
LTQFVEELWRGFAEETAEHLDAIDQLLPQLGKSDSGEAALIAALFRAFHSVKGLAGAASMRGMEVLAHEAENLLGHLRDGSARLSEDLIDALDAASEELRRLRLKATHERTDQHATPDLLATLNALAATAFPARQRPHTVQSGDYPASSPAGSLEHPADAGDEMLVLYAELLSSRIQELARAMSADTGDDCVEVLEALLHASQVVELEPIAEIFSVWVEMARSQRWPLDREARAGFAFQAGILAEKCGIVAELTGQVIDLSLLHEALLSEAEGLDDIFAALYRFADALVSDNWELARSTAAEVDRSVTGARRGLEAGGLGPLFALIQDLCARLASGSIEGSTSLANAIRQIAASIKSPDFSASNAEELLLVLSASVGLTAHSAPSEGENILPQHPIVANMPLQVKDMVLDSLRQGYEIFALTVYLEESPDLAQPLMTWMTESGRIATSVSRIRGGQSWFEFVLLSQLPREVLRSDLLELDPDFRCVRRFEQLSGDNPGVFLENSASAKPQATAVRAVAHRPDSVFRISGEVVDRVFDQIAEVSTLSSALGLALAGRAGAEVSESAHARLQETYTLLDAGLQRLHRDALQMRVVSIDSVFSRLPRAARGLAKELGKKVELSLEGGEVRIDKSIVDRLTDPLMHMVRNSIDHGVEPPALRLSSGKPETAQLRISASQEGPEVLIVVADDGRGIDTDSVLRRAIERGLVASHEVESLSPELIYGFIFTPGFSTASVVTETSGRGVGMDVVLNTVRELGGSIHTASDRGRGTRFTIRLPLSAAMQGISRVEVSGERFGINDRFVSRVGMVSRDSLRVVGKHRQATLRGHSLTFASLAEILWGEVEAQAEAAIDPQPVIVLRWGEQEVALAVDRLLGRRTVFIRELHPMLSLVPFLSGTTIEGDGTILMVLDGGALLASAVEADDHRSKLQQHAVG